MYIPSLLNAPPTSHPVPPLQVVTEQQVELPVLYSNFPLASYLTHGSVCVSVLLSPSISPSPAPTVEDVIFEQRAGHQII